MSLPLLLSVSDSFWPVRYGSTIRSISASSARSPGQLAESYPTKTRHRRDIRRRRQVVTVNLRQLRAHFERRTFHSGDHFLPRRRHRLGQIEVRIAERLQHIDRVLPKGMVIAGGHRPPLGFDDADVARSFRIELRREAVGRQILFFDEVGPFPFDEFDHIVGRMHANPAPDVMSLGIGRAFVRRTLRWITTRGLAAGAVVVERAGLVSVGIAADDRRERDDLAMSRELGLGVKPFDDADRRGRGAWRAIETTDQQQPHFLDVVIQIVGRDHRGNGRPLRVTPTGVWIKPGMLSGLKSSSAA